MVPYRLTGLEVLGTVLVVLVLRAVELVDEEWWLVGSRLLGMVWFCGQLSILSALCMSDGSSPCSRHI